jgi:hypothetical protein
MSLEMYIKPEWSFEVLVDEIGESGLVKEALANETECKDIARRLDVEKILNLKASVHLFQDKGSITIHAKGSFSADVVQKCVVSLEPVNSHINEEFEVWFSDTEHVVSLNQVRQEKESNKKDTEVEIPSEKDDPEAVIDGRIELGEIIIQNLALSINPYPHAEGAVYKNVCDHPDDDANKNPRHKPFAELKNWKKEQEKDH